MNLKCLYYFEGWWPNNRLKYTCKVENQQISDRKIASFMGQHITSFGDRGNENVTAIWFEVCPMTVIPKNLIEFFPNLEILFVNKCGLKTISNDDLTRMPKLCEILLIGNEISSLSDDLFNSMRSLEMITLNDNKITKIGDKIFKKVNHDKVKFIDLRRNNCINAVYAKESNLFPFEDGYLRASSVRKLTKLIKSESKQNLAENKRFSTDNRLLDDIKCLLSDEKFKDFTINIKCDSFKVHKFIFIARSPVIADMIHQNPHCNQLQLVDIPIDVFRSILDYVYNDKLPVDDSNLIEIYGAACKLKIEGLREHAIDNLLDTVCAFNALEILILSSKYGDESLMVKSFEEIRKMFPDKRLKSELMYEPDRIREMIIAKRAMDEQVKRVREEFDNLEVFK